MIRWLIVILLLTGFQVHSQTIEGLVQGERIRINSYVRPAEDIIARQQVKLYIEVSTDTRFSGGTRIKHFEIPNAIVLQRETFAVNSTVRELGKSWATQLWTLEIFPLSSGQFTVPAIELELSVIKTGLESITGNTQTTPFSFEVGQPALLEENEAYVVTDRFTVFEQYNQQLEEYNAGDALTRTIVMNVDDVPAMMLPELSTEDIEGIGVYQKPAAVNDTVNRGDFKGSRKEVFTYVFEKPGTYHLPAMLFYWWDLSAGELKTIDLPEKQVSVSGTIEQIKAAENSGAATDKLASLDWKQILRNLMVLLLVVWLLRKVFEVGYPRYREFKQAMHKHRAPERLQARFRRAVSKGDTAAMLDAMYSWLSLQGNEDYEGAFRPMMIKRDEKILMEAFEKVMAAHYSNQEQQQSVALEAFARQVSVHLKEKRSKSPFAIKGVELTLN